MITILVYAVANRSSGGLSVLSDYYEEILNSKDRFKSVRWIILTGAEGFKSSQNVKVIEVKHGGGNLVKRYVKVKRLVDSIIKKYQVNIILSLQNTRLYGANIPYIISLHNVLPLYRCDSEVLDSIKLRIKQRVLNRLIISSLKRAWAVLVPSGWIKDAYAEKCGVPREKFIECGLSKKLYRLKIIKDDTNISNLKEEAITGFIYPATAFPYKNHKVILDACEILKKEGNKNFNIVMTIDVKQGKTSRRIYKKVKEKKFPVIFYKYENRDDLFKAYTNKVLIFPSKIETDALPLLESRGMGGYSIVADLPYAHAALDNYEGTEFFDPDNPRDLAARMRKIICNGIPAYAKDNSSDMDSNELSRLEQIVRIAEESKRVQMH